MEEDDDDLDDDSPEKSHAPQVHVLVTCSGLKVMFQLVRSCALGAASVLLLASLQ